MDPTIPAPLRTRHAGPRELDGIPWLGALDGPALARALAALRVVEVVPGERVCQAGSAGTCWFGVIKGLLKISRSGAKGECVTFAGLPPGGWFGEGSAIRREPYLCDLQALRASVVAVLPVETFHWLLGHSIGFNRFVLTQLDERLRQFILARECERLCSPDVRVARHLAALCNPVLCPGVQDVLRITQQELAYLVGLSRQRVNEGLQCLQAQRLIRIEYGGVRVLDLARLRVCEV